MLEFALRTRRDVRPGLPSSPGWRPPGAATVPGAVPPEIIASVPASLESTRKVATVGLAMEPAFLKVPGVVLATKVDVGAIFLVLEVARALGLAALHVEFVGIFLDGRIGLIGVFLEPARPGGRILLHSLFLQFLVRKMENFI